MSQTLLSRFLSASATTGSPTVTTAGGYRIYKFTASGSITFRIYKFTASGSITF